MVMPVGARRSATPCARAPRSSTRCAPPEEGAATRPGSATKAVRADLKSNREALDVVLEAVDKAGYTAGRGRVPRARRRGERALGQTAGTCSRNPAKPTRTPDEMVDDLADWVRAVPHRLDRGRPRRRRLGRLEGADQGARRPRPARRRRRVRHQPGDPQARHRRRASPTRSSSS